MIFFTCDKCGNDAAGVPEITAVIQKSDLKGKKINFKFPDDNKPMVMHRVNLCEKCYRPYTKALIDYVYEDEKK